jgi:hypothetical protein
MEHSPESRRAWDPAGLFLADWMRGCVQLIFRANRTACWNSGI